MKIKRLWTISFGLEKGPLMVILSGLLLGLSFPKAGLWPLAWFSLAWLFRTLEGRTPWESFKLGFIFGWVFFLFTQYWINNSIYHYGGLPFLAGLGIVGLLSAYEALYTGVFASLSVPLLKRNGLRDIIFMGAIWVVMEYVRGIFLTGFPWSLLGYSQTAFLPLMQISDITGVYGVSFIVVLGNLIIYNILFRGWKAGRDIVVVSLICMAIVYGLIRYENLKNIQPSETLRVAIVQPDIDQSVKWDPRYRRDNLKRLFRLTIQTTKERPELVIWPETALPFYFGSDALWTMRLQQFVVENKLTLLTGAPIVRDIKRTNSGYQYITSNSAILLGKDGKVLGSYDKIHLVPFGEYVPLRKALFFINRLTEGIGEFKRGEDYTVFEVDGKRFFVIICYEAIFPALVRSFKEVDFMVNITNDAWFGDTSGPYQHAEIARVRAIEMRRPLVRVANSGISEVVDITGKIIKATGLNTQWSGVVELSLRRAESLYQKIGDLFSYIMFLIAGISILINYGSRRR